MCLKQLEGDYLKVEITHENIGDAHNEQGHDEEAKKRYDRVLAIYVQSLGLEHVYVRILQNKVTQLQQITRMQTRVVVL